MAKSNRPAGGLGSRVVVRPGVRVGAPAREQRPAGVSQIGSSIGNHATEGPKILRKGVEPVRGAPIAGGLNVKLGNEVAKNVGLGGPGKGREVMRSGSQSTHGPVAGTSKPAGREILNAFGPDSASVRGRK
jgi:hypothetical protein